MHTIRQIDGEALDALAGQGPVQILDVRTREEVERGMIEGAIHIPLSMLPHRVGELDWEAVTVVYCRSGARSAQACAYLAAQGFAGPYNLKGGILEWLRSGRAVVLPVWAQ